jgi:hypothetical protein
MAAARKLLASAAGSNLGNRVAPPKHPPPSSGDDKEK